MTKGWLLLILVLALLIVFGVAVGSATASPGTLYVKPSATGSGNCSNWANACTLQTALGMASDGDEIWVAEGIHKPGASRTDTFQLVNGVEIYGGFQGTETDRDQRDWTVHETILSGDIGTVGDDSDNSYHVIIGSGTDATAVLDGFTVSGGFANGSEPDHCGGGMYNDGGSPTLTNVSFSSNSAYDYWGGGMYNYESGPTLTNVTFSSNSAGDAGGGIYNYSSSPALTNVTFTANSAYDGAAMVNAYSSPTLTNVIFTGNSADGSAGGMYNSHSSPALTNVIFSGNSASDSGGGMANWYGNPTLTNVSFSSNSAADKGGAIVIGSSSPTLRNCILWGNSAFAGTQIYNYFGGAPAISYTLVEGGCPAGATCDHILDTAPWFVDADGADDIVGTPDDDLRLVPVSPAVNAGDNDALPPDTLDLDEDGNTSEKLPFDLDGNPRVFDGIVDLGAYEAQMVPLKTYVPLAISNHGL